MALFMLGWAFTLSMPGSTFTISSYRDFAALGLTETDLAIGYGILGMGRVVLLIANGSFRRGAGGALRLLGFRAPSPGSSPPGCSWRR